MFSSFLEEEGRQERNPWYHNTQINFGGDVSDHVDEDPLPLNIPMSEDDEEIVVKHEFNEDYEHSNEVAFVCDAKQNPGVGNNGAVIPEEAYYYSYDYSVNQNYFEQVHYGSLAEYHEYNYFNYNPDQVYSNTYYFNHEEHFYTTVPCDFSSLNYQIPIPQQVSQDVDQKPIYMPTLKQEYPEENFSDEQGNSEHVPGTYPPISFYPPQFTISQTQQCAQQSDIKPSHVYVKQEPSDENMLIDILEDNSEYDGHLFGETSTVHNLNIVPYSNSNQSVDGIHSGNSDDLVKKDFRYLRRRRNFTKGVKKTKCRIGARKEEELTNIPLPDGFEEILERASTENSDPNNRRWKQKFRRREEIDRFRKRDLRRCETKVMLQSADGKLFNKFFEEDDIREFAKKFKVLRTEYGFSQSDVGEALGKRYGLDFSQTTISRFESLVLSHTNMCKLRPPIEAWLNDVKTSLERGITVDDIKRAYRNGDFWIREKFNEENTSLVLPIRKRKRRTSLEACQKVALEAFFDKNQKPDYSQMMDISESLDLCFEVIRVWFSNRRQKLRKTGLKKKESWESNKNNYDEMYMNEYGS